MANKTGKTGNLGLFAFLAIILVAIAFLFVGLQALFQAWNINIDVTWMSRPASVLRWIAEVIMTLIICYCSYDFAMKQTKGWRIVWWVLAIIAVCSVIGLGGFNVFR
jgi:hypothetical protein